MTLSLRILPTGSHKVLLLLLSLFFFRHAAAQDHSNPPLRTAAQSDDHGRQAEINELEAAKQRYAAEVQEVYTDHTAGTKGGWRTTAGLPDTSCVLTIPVVLHVFHPSGSAGVTMSQIEYAINDLNITFAGADADYLSVNSLFAGVKSYTKIRFALATIDPKGNPTTGVVYYKDKQSGLGNGTGYDAEIQTMAWDNYKYFNIYIMNDLYANGVTNNSGVCWYPFIGMSDAGTARMVYNYWYLGFGGSSFNDHEFNETFTHECGHYLNLYHTFEGSSCSGTGDLCADTPPTDIAAAGCVATRCSGSINGENYMDYNASCYKNFTMDQNTRMETAMLHPARRTLWQYANLVATGIVSPTSTNACVNASKFFSFSKTTLTESQVNDGSIEVPPVKIYACGGALFAAGGTTLVAGAHYNISGLPAGLTATVVTASDSKSATLTIGGYASAHAKINSVTNVVFTFTNAAVSGGSVSLIKNYTDTFRVDFYDPWGKTCVSPSGISASATTTWTRFETSGPIPRYFGVWYDAGKLYLENYGRGIITQSLSSDNIVFLPAGTIIGPASAWRAGGGQGLLYSSGYTALDGLTGFVGFRTQAGADFYYGWMKIKVTHDSVTLLEYQYNNKPNLAIAAGAPCLPLEVDDVEPATTAIYPNPSIGTIFIDQPMAAFSGSTYEVYYMDGRVVLSGSISSPHHEISGSQLAAGVYLLSIRNAQGQVTSVNRLSIVR